MTVRGSGHPTRSRPWTRTVNTPSPSAPDPPAAPAGFALWVRSEWRRPWELVAVAPTELEVLGRMGGRGNADWTIQPTGKNPNGKALRGPTLLDGLDGLDG